MSFCKATRTYFNASEGIEAVNQFGEKHLYSPYANFFYCIDCGERLVTEQVKEDEYPTFSRLPFETSKREQIKKGEFITPKDLRRDSGDNGLCDKCKDKGDYLLCDDCDRFTLKEDINLITLWNGNEIKVCQDCIDDHYSICDDCNYWIDRETDDYSEIDGRIVCQECREQNYHQCENCGEWLTNDETYETDDGHTFCSDCFHDEDYVVQCYECNRYIIRDNAEWDEDNDNYFCCDCANGGNSNIHNYGYKPNPKMHGKDNEFFGFEIEVEGKRNKANEFLKEFGDTEENDIYLKQDGSVYGFEIVTQPMSRKYFYREFVPKLEKGMKYLRNNGFKGHNRAGIHIHVSTEAINEDMLKKMMILMYSKQKKTYKIWLKITQRKHDKMEQWSSMSPNSLYGTKKDVAHRLDRNKALGRKKKPDLSDCRYTAINCRNEKTIEFRIFNSNIRTERIIKNAQVIFSLIDFTKTDRLPTMNNYLKFIESNSKVYPELYDFLIEKEILLPKEQKEKIEELMSALNVKSINGLKNSLTEIQNKQAQQVAEGELNNEEDERNTLCA